MNRGRRRKWTISAVVLVAACDILSARVPTSISVSPSAATLALGENVWLSAVVLDQQGATMDGVAVTWSSSQPAVAGVGTGGLVLAISPGTTQITASADKLSQSVTVTVYGPFVLSIFGTVTSAVWNPQTQQYDCYFTLTASATGGRVDASAGWSTGKVEFRFVNGTITSFSLGGTDLLDYFGSTRISTGETQIASRFGSATAQFDLFYTIRAVLPDGVLSSTSVFVDCF